MRKDIEFIKIMEIIHLVINGIIGATINSEHLDLNKTTIQEIHPNIYFFESGEIYYKWKQKEKGGKAELISDSNFHQGGFKTNSLNYDEVIDYIEKLEIKERKKEYDKQQPKDQEVMKKIINLNLTELFCLNLSNYRASR